MTVAVVVLAALWVSTCVLLLVERRRRRQDAAAAAAAIAAVETELASVRSELSATTASADAERRDLTAEVDRLGSELERSRRDQQEAEGSRRRLAEQLEEASERERCLQDRLRAGVGGKEPALWSLELLRSERTWRHSVAPVPGGTSPFAETDDPLRVAVEVEAAALREEVGAPLEVEWRAEVVEPGDALLLLRLAQELLAAAARQGAAVVLNAQGASEVVLHLHTTDEDEGEVLAVDVPDLPGELLSVSRDDGLRVVVHLT